MGIFGKLFKGPEIDQAKSADSKQKMRRLFDSVVPDGGQYQLVAAYTEDARRSTTVWSTAARPPTAA